MHVRTSSLVAILFAAAIQLFLCRIAQAQQPALFGASTANNVGSSSTVSRFDLTTLQGTPIATVGGFSGQGLACGPDGKLYVTLSGFGCCSPARKIVRLNLDGTGQTTVLDFDTTPALATSGGPNVLAFGADGTLFFNTVLSHGSLLATGVWKLPPPLGSVAPTQVVLPVAPADSYGLALGFLTAPPFAGDVIASLNNQHIVRVAPPFDSPQAGIDFITGLGQPGGFAIDSNGDVFVSEGVGQGGVSKYAPDGTFISTFAISGNTGGNGGLAFDGAGNLYVTTSRGSVVRIAPDGTQTPFGDVTTTPAGDLTVCPAGFLNFPLGGFTYSTAPILTVFDHSSAGGFYCSVTQPPPNVCGCNAGDGHVVDYTAAEIGDVNFLTAADCNLAVAARGRKCVFCGYPNKMGTDFLANGNYKGGKYLFYDGHPGFDFAGSDPSRVFSAEAGTLVLAPADGTVQLLPDDNVNGDPTRFNTFKLKHGVVGQHSWETWFLHTGRKKGDFLVSDGQVVHHGDPIAIIGAVGAVGPHLHFELRRDGVPVDPYGWQGPPSSDPYPIESILAWNLYTPVILTAVSPSRGKPGTTFITLAGQHFSTNALIEAYKRGDLRVNPIVPVATAVPSGTSTQLTATLTLTSPGNYWIVVANQGNRRSNGQPFRVK